MWRQDNNFGRQRLQGCNTISVCRCTELPETFGVISEMVEPFLEGQTLDEAIEDKKIYIVDHSFMKDIQCTDNRKVVAPMALFHVDSRGQLMPIAIQLFPNFAARQHPVFVPSDPNGVWTLVKMYFNNADSAFHQSCAHLAFTHLIMEGIAVVTNRELSQSHPIFRLLAPHFLFLLAINSRALAKLVQPGGWIDKCMTIGSVGLMNIIKKKFADWRMNVEGWLPRDLRKRGVADTEALPYYPYRDDALLVHKAIKSYVKEIVNAHYDVTDKLTNDYEIQNWANSLVDEEGLGLKGVPGNGKFTSNKHLTKVLTSIIFMGSVGHAAANFSQYDDYAFPANYPAFLRGNPPEDKADISDEEILQHLPDKNMTLSIAAITKLLSDRGTNSLGCFEKKYMFDPIGEAAHSRFTASLKEITKNIAKRNETRPEKYPYLDPNEVPNAISI